MKTQKSIPWRIEMSRDARWLFAHYPCSFVGARSAAVLLAVATVYLGCQSLALLYRLIAFGWKTYSFSAIAFWFSLYFIGAVMTFYGARLVYGLWMFRRSAWMVTTTSSLLVCLAVLSGMNWRNSLLLSESFRLFGTVVILLLISFPIFRDRAADS